MSIYELDIKGIRKLFIKFHKSTYGKTVFLLAYVIPFFLFGVGLVQLIYGIVQQCPTQTIGAAKTLGAFVVTFILGNVYFYSEVRKFCEHEEAKKK